MTRPLEGLRVLDLSRLIPGPFATMVLADLGATVDRVEDPGVGDYLRAIPPSPSGMSGAFATLNRGKRSMVVDLKRPEGRDLVLDLVARYDVLFEQFRPGVLARLGLGHDVLRAKNPRLVVCALSGYGQTGPLAQRAGHDLDYLARAGVLGLHGPADGPPQVPGFQVADVGGGLFAVIAILAALAARDRTGEGAVLDVSLAESAMAFASHGLGNLLGGVVPARGDDILTGGIAPYRAYATSDGGSVALGALEPKFWTTFCVAVGLEPEMSALAPGPHQAALQARLAGIFASRTRDEWEAFAREHDCCLEPVLRPDELEADAHLVARGVFVDVPGGVGGGRQLRTPVTPRDAELTPAPEPGRDTDAILRDAGLDEARIAALRASGAVR